MKHCERLLSRIENRNRLTIYGPSSVIGSGLSQAGVGAGGGALGTTVGLLSNPVTAIIGAGLGVVQLIFGIKAHHKQAVKTEAAALSDLTGRVTQAFKDVFTQVNTGAATREQAAAELDAIFPAYEDAIYKQYKVKNKSGNGPDKIEKQFRVWLDKAKNVFMNSAGGTVTFDALEHHGDYKGQASFSLSLNPIQSAAPGNTTGLATDTSSWDGPDLPGTKADSFFISERNGYQLPAGLWTWVLFGVIALVVFKMARH